MTPKLITLEDVAKTLSCTVPCLRRWRREGRIAVIKIGRLVRVAESELDRITKEGVRPATRRSQ